MATVERLTTAAYWSTLSEDEQSRDGYHED